MKEEETKIIVSIIVPCFKQAQYLSEALESVLNQSFTFWECIIVNDGSPDNTEEVALDWCKKDKRFRYLYLENGGLSNARNKGIEKAKGEFILPLDADDKIAENYLKFGIESFKNDASLKIVYCKAEKFDKQFGVWDFGPFSLRTLAKYNMIFCSAIFKKEDWIFANGYDVNMIYGLEDWEFWINILKNDGKVLKLDYTGFYYRVKTTSMTTQLTKKRIRKMQEYISVKHAGFLVSQMGSFHVLEEEKREKENLNLALKKEFKKKLKSKKFLLKTFFKSFYEK